MPAACVASSEKRRNRLNRYRNSDIASRSFLLGVVGIAGLRATIDSLSGKEDLSQEKITVTTFTSPDDVEAQLRRIGSRYPSIDKILMSAVLLHQVYAPDLLGVRSRLSIMPDQTVNLPMSSHSKYA